MNGHSAGLADRVHMEIAHLAPPRTASVFSVRSVVIKTRICALGDQHGTWTSVEAKDRSPKA